MFPITTDAEESRTTFSFFPDSLRRPQSSHFSSRTSSTGIPEVKSHGSSEGMSSRFPFPRSDVLLKAFVRCLGPLGRQLEQQAHHDQLTPTVEVERQEERRCIIYSESPVSESIDFYALIRHFRFVITICSH